MIYEHSSGNAQARQRSARRFAPPSERNSTSLRAAVFTTAVGNGNSRVAVSGSRRTPDLTSRVRQKTTVFRDSNRRPSPALHACLACDADPCRSAPNVKTGTIFATRRSFVASHILPDRKDEFLQLAKSSDRFRGAHIIIQLGHGRSLGVKKQVDRTHHTMTLPNSTAPVK